MNFEITLEILGIVFCTGCAHGQSGVSTIRRFIAAQDSANSKQFEEFPEGLR